MRAWRTMAAAALLAAAAAPPASGHGGSAAAVAAAGRFRTVIEDAPAVPRLRVTLHDGRIPAIFVRNDTGRTLDVPGRDGRPAIRIGPAGVAVRRARWVRVAPAPAWAWLETPARVPARIRGGADLGRRARTVLRWTTPMRLAGRTLTLRGRVDWLPAAPPVATPPRCEVAPWCGATGR